MVWHRVQNRLRHLGHQHVASDTRLFVSKEPPLVVGKTLQVSKGVHRLESRVGGKRQAWRAGYVRGRLEMRGVF